MRKYMKIGVIGLLGITILILGALVGKYGYDYYRYEMNASPQELENRKIDEYNLGELEKAKKILNDIGKDDEKFFTLKEFNEIYNANIKPIKNCYYVSNSNGNEKYIFGFQLYSNKYKEKLGGKNENDDTIYYAYPKYDLPYDTVCFGLGEGGCSDFIYDRFIYTISNPCED